jgi:hypothetical protein
MIKNTRLTQDTYARIDELVRISREAVAKAQDESRRLGVPNVYAFNGRLYYETPTGELSLFDPYTSGDKGTEQVRI